MAVDGRSAFERRAPPTTRSDQLVFRCHGCASRFTDDPAGPGVCPRCRAIGGHERLGRATAAADGE